MTGARLHVDLDRLRANLDTLRARIAPAELMVVVKNDAYGHGVERIVAEAAAHGVRWFGTFDVATGVRVRSVVGAEPRVFAWMTAAGADIDRAVAAALELGVGDATFLEDVAAARGGIPVHLKIDTGLRRNGIRPEEWDGFTARAAELEAAGLIRVAGLWSHIAEVSDESDDDARAEFLDAVAVARRAGTAPDTLHLAASAAGYARPEFRFGLVRFGAFTYGIRSTGAPGVEGIAPIATLLAPVIRVDGGEVEVGYGSLDGLPSTLGGRVTVGTPAGARPLLRVAETTLTVAAWPGASVGDEVAIFGPGTQGESDATALAEAIGTVGEEILVRVSPLVPRTYA